MIHICCVICKEFFLPNSEMCVTMCGHFYHQLCIDKWRDRSGSCPQCRQKLNVKPVKAYIDSCDSSNSDNIWDMKVKMDNLRESIDNMKKKNELDNESIEKLKKTLEEHSSKNNLLRERIKPLNERVKSLVDKVESLKPLCAKHQLYEARIESMKKWVYKMLYISFIMCFQYHILFFQSQCYLARLWKWNKEPAEKNAKLSFSYT